MIKKDNYLDNYRLIAFLDVRNGDTSVVRSTAHTKDSIGVDRVEYPMVKLQISSSSQPSYTRKMKLVDTAGCVDNSGTSTLRRKGLNRFLSFSPQNAPLPKSPQPHCQAFPLLAMHPNLLSRLIPTKDSSLTLGCMLKVLNPHHVKTDSYTHRLRSCLEKSQNRSSS